MKSLCVSTLFGHFKCAIPLFVSLWILQFGSSRSVAAETAEASDRPPNIIFILADDLGWSELGCYGNTFHETPHIDRLASEGMRFTQAYAAAPVCSPYRAALLTGRHPARLGITDYLRPNSANALPATGQSLADLLGRHGYATGMIGKWHLTGYHYHGAEHEIRPADHGFQWDFGTEVKSVGNGANFWPYVFRDQPIRWLDIETCRLGASEYLTDRLNLEAIDFVERHQQEPFFLYLSHYAPHTILNGRPDLVEKYQKKHPPGKSSRPNSYISEDAGLGKGDPLHHWAQDHNPHLAAMIESIDHGVGQLQEKLEALGLSENTIFIFTSDNGGETNVTSNAPLRGGKSQLYEGGIRVPLVIKWPRTIPNASTCMTMTQNIDFLPTLAEAAGITEMVERPLDGVSTLRLWKDPEAQLDRSRLFWHYPLDQPHFLGGRSGGAIRDSRWKLIENFTSEGVELYDLEQDPGEKTNVAAEHPDQVQRLSERLVKWRDEVSARVPSPPLLANLNSLYFADHFGEGQVSDRLWYNADWKAEKGVLRRLPGGSANTRIRLHQPAYKDVVIRFDFKIQKAQDIRLMTGGQGGYHAVLHLRPDHFFLQTAKDSKTPHFSYRHSECQYAFDPNRWYTITVEMVGDEMIAHVDSDHLVYAKHPMIDRNHDYLAIQVDQFPATFDNFQVLSASPANSETHQHRIAAAVNRYPVQKTVEEAYKIQYANAQEWFYQRDEAYRDLVKQVDAVDQQLKDRFSDAFQSHKEFRKKLHEMKMRLMKDDPVFKEKLHATHRANRAIDQWLELQQPEVKELPASRKKASIDQSRVKFVDHPEYQKLLATAHLVQQELEQAYPQLDVTDEAISEMRKKSRDLIKDQPKFKELTKKRADTFQAARAYLITHDPELASLNRQLESGSR